MDFQPLKYIYRSTAQPGAYTLLLLHGTGGDEADLLPLAQRFGNRINILSLRGNVSEGGMPRFFRRLGIGVFDEKDLEFRTHEIAAFLRATAAKEGFDSSRLIALGYSNGANIAGSMLGLYPDLLAGAILYRPMQPFRSMPDHANSKHTPVFTSNGAADPTIDPAATQAYLDILRKKGFDVEGHNLNAGHQLTAEDLALSIQWFQKYFGNGAV